MNPTYKTPTRRHETDLLNRLQFVAIVDRKRQSGVDKVKTSKIAKGQYGAKVFIVSSFALLFALLFDMDIGYKIILINMMAACFILACIWILIYIRCPKCNKFVGEYGILSPPIKVPKACQHCGQPLKDEYDQLL